MCNQWKDTRTLVDACALTGAAAFFAGIPDAALVANGPLWCYYYALRYLEKQSPAVGARFFCTQADNQAVVYGTEECLLETLAIIRKQACPSVILVENSCSVSLIGDDIAGIARQADMKCPVVCIDSGGLAGGFSAGYRAAASAYFNELPLRRKSCLQHNTVNLLGCTTGYYNGANDVAELKRMLHLAGCRVLACPGAGSSAREIAAMTDAALNIVVHEELGLDLAKLLQEQYGMPYVSLMLPYGLQGSFSWLQYIVEYLSLARVNLDEVQREVGFLEHKIQTATLEMQRIWGDLWFEKTLIAAPVSTALALAAAIRTEWLDTRLLTVAAYGCKPGYPVPDCIDTFIEHADSQLMEQELAALQGGCYWPAAMKKPFCSNKRFGMWFVRISHCRYMMKFFLAISLL